MARPRGQRGAAVGDEVHVQPAVQAVVLVGEGGGGRGVGGRGQAKWAMAKWAMAKWMMADR